MSETGTALPPPEKYYVENENNYGPVDKRDQPEKVSQSGLNLSSSNVPKAKIVNVSEETYPVNEQDDAYITQPQLLSADFAPSNKKPNVDSRLATLEAAVASLRADYDQIVPTFKQLSVNSDRIESLLDQIEKQPVSSSNPQNRMSSTASHLAPIMAIGQNGILVVQEVRIAQHPDKTRVVIDMNGLGAYEIDVDNENKILMVSLPNSEWKAGSQEKPINSEIISGWSYQSFPGSGSTLIIQLKRPVAIKNHNALPANGKFSPRIYLDITKL